MLCPVCLGEGPHEKLLEHRDPFGGRVYALRLCPACGAAFSDPMENPGPEWYARAAASWTPAERPPVPAWRLEVLRRVRRERPGLKKLLEIGCSDGAFLLAARAAGFEPAGVDFDAAATAAARAAGLSGVVTATFEEFSAGAPGKYDVIAFFQTLEHLTDPRGFLRKAAGLLNPGGLIIFDLPDAARPMPSGSGLIDLPPHHLTRWTRRTVLKFLEDGGFEPVELGSLATYRILRDALGARLAAALGSAKRALVPARPAASAPGAGSAPVPGAAGPSASFRAFDLAWRRLLAPLLAPLLLLWLLALKARRRGFYLNCVAARRGPS